MAVKAHKALRAGKPKPLLSVSIECRDRENGWEFRGHGDLDELALLIPNQPDVAPKPQGPILEWFNCPPTMI